MIPQHTQRQVLLKKKCSTSGNLQFINATRACTYVHDESSHTASWQWFYEMETLKII